MKALIYVRCAVMRQDWEKNSLIYQRDVCLEYAKANGYEVDISTDIYMENGVSGRTMKHRLALEEMTKRLKSDPTIDAVIVRDVTRLFRNMLQYFTYKKEITVCGKKIISATEPINGTDVPANFLMESMILGFTEFRSRQLQERIKQIKLLRKAQRESLT